MDDRERFRGSILGLAIGDALGHPTEFVGSVHDIRARWGPQGVTGFQRSGSHAAGTFTDDTQMTIAVARALIRAGHQPLDELMRVMGEEFVAWSRSPENDRAPGGTCLRGCRSLAEGVPWRLAGVAGSKGCGAAMRAAPVGLYFFDDVDAMVRVSAAQSSLTHRHPTGIASGVGAAAPVAHVMREKSLDGIIEFTRSCVEQLDAAYLVQLGCDPESAERIGNREMLDAIDRLASAKQIEAEDVCKLLGGAWVGEEAVVTALWCALRAGSELPRSGPEPFRDAVLRGANSSGDSDSIACIAGSIAGALVGPAGIDEAWARTVEKADLLAELAEALHRARGGADEPAIPGMDPFGAERRTGGQRLGEEETLADTSHDDDFAEEDIR